MRRNYIQKSALLLGLLSVTLGVSVLPSYIHNENPELKVAEGYLIDVTAVGKEGNEKLLFAVMDTDGDEYMAAYDQFDINRLRSGCPSIKAPKLEILIKEYYAKRPVEMTMNVRWFASIKTLHITDKIINFECHA